jgi:hypothetical protein
VRRVFDPPAPVALDQGIGRMAEWVKHQGPAKPAEFDDIEVAINLPPSWLPKGLPKQK